jgi:DNA-directed RNA polymerase alpha subunit
MKKTDALPPKMGKPAERALAHAGIQSLTDLSRFTEQEILNLHGIGKKAMTIMQQAMAANKISFKKMSVSRK